MDEDTKRLDAEGIVLIVVLISAIIAVTVQNSMKRRAVVLDISTSEAFASVLNDFMCIEATSEDEPSTGVTEATTVRPTETTTKKAETTTEIITAAPLPEMTEAYYEEEYEYDSGHGSYIGYFELTAYEWTGEPMANGEYPYYGACASNYFPLGTTLYIEGYGTFVVKDRGGMANNVIDIYLGDPAECIEFGRRTAEVYYG